METPTVLKYQNNKTVFFEPDTAAEVNNAFVQAKEYLNSIFLETGSFNKYAFNRDFVTKASENEAQMYLALKDRSVHLIGKNH